MRVYTFNQINPKRFTRSQKNTGIPSPPMYLSKSIIVNIISVED